MDNRPLLPMRHCSDGNDDDDFEDSMKKKKNKAPPGSDDDQNSSSEDSFCGVMKKDDDDDESLKEEDAKELVSILRSDLQIVKNELIAVKKFLKESKTENRHLQATIAMSKGMICNLQKQLDEVNDHSTTDDDDTTGLVITQLLHQNDLEREEKEKVQKELVHIKQLLKLNKEKNRHQVDIERKEKERLQNELHNVKKLWKETQAKHRYYQSIIAASKEEKDNNNNNNNIPMIQDSDNEWDVIEDVDSVLN